MLATSIFDISRTVNDKVSSELHTHWFLLLLWFLYCTIYSFKLVPLGYSISYSCIHTLIKVFHSLVKKGPPPPNSSFRSFSMEPVAKVYPDHDECSPDHVDYSPPPLPKRKPKCEDRDTNILMIKFGALSKPCKVHTGDPVICSNDQCTAILNCHSKITKEEEGEGNVRFIQQLLRINIMISYYNTDVGMGL